MLTLLIDKSIAKRIVAKKGDKVKLIATHGDVLIVEGKERFAVKVEDVKQTL